MEQLVKNECPVCLSSNIDKDFSCPDYMITKEVFDIDKCDSCGFLFTNPVPSLDKIGQYYEGDAYVSHSNTKRGLKNFIYHIVRQFTLERKIDLVKRYVSRGTLLDIGSGAGYFLKKSVDEGYDSFGLEPSVTVRNTSIREFGLDVRDISVLHTLEKSSVDIITMWHVLEHVYDLNKDLDKMLSVLKEDGVMIIAVPNPGSWDAKFYKEYWGGWDVPRHLYHFTEKDIRHLFGRYNCEVVEVKPMQFDPVYVSMLSESYRGGSVFNAIFNGMRSYFNKNKFGCTSQIYVIKKTAFKTI